MNPIAHLPPALAIVGLMAACAAAPDESSGASISTAPIASATTAPTVTPSVAPDPSETAALLPSDEVIPSGGAAERASVEIVGFAYAPAELTIRAGSEVTFTNLDSFSHTATAGTGDKPMPTLFDSGRLPQGDSFSFAFAEAGTYAYFCVVHPAMEASITVEE